MQFTNRKRRQPPAVIIVSLIDVLIVVLIFLVASTTFKRPSAVRLELPESSQGAPSDTNRNPLLIEVTKEPPFFYFNGKSSTIEQIQSGLKTAIGKDPKTPVALRADAKAPFGEIMKIMDAAKSAGVNNLSAYTKKAAE